MARLGSSILSGWGLVSPLLLALLVASWNEAHVSSLDLREGQRFQNRSFKVDYDRNAFLMDGAPFRYISGSIHYFRVPRGLWKDRLTKVRAAGFNAIQFVIPWNIHQRHPNTTDFTGDLDIEAFLQVASDLGLYALVRPGPYICAERNGGGLPWWLYKLHPDIKLRSSDRDFLAHVSDWWNVLLPVLRKHLYSNGGNVLMVQLENEYGSFPSCDLEYTTFLRDTALGLLGPDAVLYTTDGAGTGYLRCGKVPGVYATVDFGPGGDVANAFRPQRLFEPRGPLVNSELYPGWLDYWGSPHAKRDANATAAGLEKVLQYEGASVSVYMAHGGTSFGFENGINGCGSGDRICPEPTSYDYDALISEAGDLTPKFYAFKDVITKYLPDPKLDVSNTSKMNIGKVEVKFVTDIFQGLQFLSSKTLVSDNPVKFEDLDQENGFVLYRHQVVGHSYRDPCVLQVASGVRDRAQVFVNQNQVGLLSRQEGVGTTAVLPALRPGDTLDILVENQGRIGFQMPNVDFKGILGDVTASGQALKNWTMYGMPLEDTWNLRRATKAAWSAQDPSPTPRGGGQGSLWLGKFTPDCSQPGDTFLRLDGWSKGVAYVNGFNLGRYWPAMGPQVTLYVPQTLIKCGAVNTMYIFEQERPACRNSDGTVSATCQVELVDQHVVDGPVPEGTAESTKVASTLMRARSRSDLLA